MKQEKKSHQTAEKYYPEERFNHTSTNLNKPVAKIVANMSQTSSYILG